MAGDRRAEVAERWSSSMQEPTIVRPNSRPQGRRPQLRERSRCCVVVARG